MDYQTNYLSSALDQLHRQNQTAADNISRESHGQYSIDNAGSQDSWDGRFLTSDLAREKQLGLLQAKLQDPSLVAGIDNQATANQNAANASAKSQHRTATGSLRASLAGRGMQGGGQDAQLTAQNDAVLANAQARAATMADEIRQAGITGLRGIEKSLVDRILAEDDNGAFDTELNASGGNTRAADMSSELQQQYGGLLSNTLAGIVTNTAQPFVTAGFDAADRSNQTNADAGTPTHNTWWNL